jgi:hypothetical protein
VQLVIFNRAEQKQKMAKMEVPQCDESSPMLIMDKVEVDAY